MTVIDVHAHMDVPEIAGLVAGRPGHEAELAAQLAAFGPESVRINIELSRTAYRSPLDDIAARLAAMDRGGVDIQAVSVIPNLYHYWADTALAEEIVAAANERIAAAVASAPDRLVGLATVALQHPESAAGQLQEAMTTLGMRGVEISTAVHGRAARWPGRVLLGSDFPFDMGVEDPVARVHAAGLGTADETSILGAAAAGSLRLCPARFDGPESAVLVRDNPHAQPPIG